MSNRESEDLPECLQHPVSAHIYMYYVNIG